LKIGEEIENPFGYGKPSPSTLRVLNWTHHTALAFVTILDSNDLDMDHFCQNLIGRELAEIT
jgi:hypothetical protein